MAGMEDILSASARARNVFFGRVVEGRGSAYGWSALVAETDNHTVMLSAQVLRFAKVPSERLIVLSCCIRIMALVWRTTMCMESLGTRENQKLACACWCLYAGAKGNASNSL